MADSQRPICAERECLERAELVVSRTSRSRPFPVCDRHALYESLVAERHGYALVLTSVRDWSRWARHVPQQHCS